MSGMDVEMDDSSHGSNPYQYGVAASYGYGYGYGSNASTGDSDDGNMIDAVDMGYGDQGNGNDEEEDMGYEECTPMPRRGSMTQAEEKQRRASIKAVMADPSLTPMAKRLSIQHLMDGRRNSMSGDATGGRRYSMNGGCVMPHCGGNASVHSCSSSCAGSSYGTPDLQHSPDSSQDQDAAMTYGYGDGPEMPNVNSKQQFAISNELTKRIEMQRPPCTHYDRKCTIISPCCGAAFGCRICHDDCPALPPKINNGGRRYHRSASLPSSFTTMDNEDTHHNIDRFAIREVICRECFTRQSSKTNKCVSCGVQFGEYHCNICNLWMSNEERPYHCADCGFCRVGGAENFRHCHQCGMCIDISLYETHNCKAGKYRSNCPVCQEYLFSSRGASHEMPCGHAIHWDCFRQLAAHDSRCPVCKKTAETRERMMPTWNAMAAGIAMQPVPPELARVVNITCNDCEGSEDARAWHFLGMQCSKCSSFNTVVDKIILTGEEAHEFLEMNAKIAAAHQRAYTENQTDGDPNRPRRRRVNRRRSAF